MNIHITEPLSIPLYPKDTNAKTQYYELDAEYEDYIYYWMQRFLADVSEVITHDETLREMVLKRKPKLFPKGKRGPNSVLSFAGGIVANRVVNDKKNISEPQLEGIEWMFGLMSNYYQNGGEEHAGKFKVCIPIRFRKSFFGLQD
jgi:hypothetical protein